jgi:hypothetical protein
MDQGLTQAPSPSAPIVYLVARRTTLPTSQANPFVAATDSANPCSDRRLSLCQ